MRTVVAVDSHPGNWRLRPVSWISWWFLDYQKLLGSVLSDVPIAERTLFAAVTAVSSLGALHSKRVIGESTASSALPVYSKRFWLPASESKELCVRLGWHALDLLRGPFEAWKMGLFEACIVALSAIPCWPAQVQVRNFPQLKRKASDSNHSTRQIVMVRGRDKTGCYPDQVGMLFNQERLVAKPSLPALFASIRHSTYGLSTKP